MGISGTAMTDQCPRINFDTLAAVLLHSGSCTRIYPVLEAHGATSAQRALTALQL